MYLKQKTYYSFFLLTIAAALSIFGCNIGTETGPVIPPEGTGKALLKFNKSEIPSEVAFITASLTRSGFETVTGRMNILTDSSADLYMSDIAAGSWHLKVEAKNSLEKVIFAGETDVTITASEVIQVILTLTPTNENVGSISIYVTWGNNTNDNKWVIQRSGTTADLHSIFFYDSSLGWAVGDSGVILKSTNAGLNWKRQQCPVKERLNSICFLDINVGWVVGNNGTVLKTTNGGLSWELNNQVTQNSLNSVSFISTLFALIVGDNGTIMYAHNEFDIIDLKSLASSENLTSSFYIKARVGWITGAGGNIYKSTDKGSHWLTTLNPPQGWSIKAISFVDTSTGIAVGESGLILKTINGGAIWTKIPPITSAKLNSIAFYNSSLGWIASENGKILKTTNGGLNWGYETTETTSNLESIVFIGETSGWAAGKNGVILKYKPAAL